MNPEFMEELTNNYTMAQSMPQYKPSTHGKMNDRGEGTLEQQAATTHDESSASPMMTNYTDSGDEM